MRPTIAEGECRGKEQAKRWRRGVDHAEENDGDCVGYRSVRRKDCAHCRNAILDSRVTVRREGRQWVGGALRKKFPSGKQNTGRAFITIVKAL